MSRKTYNRTKWRWILHMTTDSSTNDIKKFDSLTILTVFKRFSEGSDPYWCVSGETGRRWGIHSTSHPDHHVMWVSEMISRSLSSIIPRSLSFSLSHFVESTFYWKLLILNGHSKAVGEINMKSSGREWERKRAESLNRIKLRAT